MSSSGHPSIKSPAGRRSGRASFGRKRLALLAILSLFASVLLIATPREAPSALAADPLVFAAFGDYGYSDASNEQAVANIVDSKGVDLIVTTGDNSYNASEPSGISQIDWNIGKSYADYIGNYTGAYGSGSTTNRFFPAPGNHDYTDGAGISAYLSYFTLPGAGITSPGASGSELYYDFVEGPVHFFAIDSDQGQSGVDIDAQKTWLQAQLAASTSPWKVVYFHHAAFSSSTSHGSSTCGRQRRRSTACS